MAKGQFEVITIGGTPNGGLKKMWLHKQIYTINHLQLSMLNLLSTLLKISFFFLPLFVYPLSIQPRKGIRLTKALQNSKKGQHICIYLGSVTMLRGAQKSLLMHLSDFSVLQSSFAVRELTFVRPPMPAQAFNIIKF